MLLLHSSEPMAIMNTAPSTMNSVRRVFRVLGWSVLLLFFFVGNLNASANVSGALADNGNQSAGGAQGGGQSGGGNQGSGGTQSGGGKQQNGGQQGGNQQGGNQQGGNQQSAPANQASTESTILAFVGLHKDALAIAADVNNAHPKTIVIFDSSQFAGLPTYRAITGELASLAARYCATLPKAQGPNGPALESVGALDAIQEANTTLVALLNTVKTTTDLTVNSFTIPDDALVADVASQLAAWKVNVFYPGLYPLSFASATPSSLRVFPQSVEDACDSPSDVDVLQRVTLVIYFRSVSDAVVASLTKQVSALGQDISTLSKQPQSAATQAQINSDTQKKETAQKAVDQLTGLNNTFDAILSLLTKVDPNGETPQLNNLLIAEHLGKMLNNEGTLVLQIKIQKSGGESVKKSNLFYGTRFYYGGGSIVSYILFDRSGAIISARNLWSGTTYQRDKSLTKSKLLDNTSERQNSSQTPF